MENKAHTSSSKVNKESFRKMAEDSVNNGIFDDILNKFIGSIFPDFDGSKLTKEEKKQYKRDCAKAAEARMLARKNALMKKEKIEMNATPVITQKRGTTEYCGYEVKCLIKETNGNKFFEEITNDGYVGKEGITTVRTDKDGHTTTTRYSSGMCLRVVKTFLSKKDEKVHTISFRPVELSGRSIEEVFNTILLEDRQAAAKK